MEMLQSVETAEETKVDAALSKRQQIREQRKAEIQKAFENKVSQDPEFVTKCGAESGNIVVTKAYTSMAKPGLEEVKREDGSRTTAKIAGTIGYELKNVGDHPVKINAKRYTKGEDGIYVGTVQTFTVAPNKTIDLCKADTTAFAAQTEYGLSFANGRIVGGSHVDTTDYEDALASFYVKLTEGSISDIAKNLDDKSGNLVEKLDVFGYLLNPAPEKERKERAKKTDDARAKMTAYIQSLRQ